MSEPSTLGRWYAEPLSPNEARQRLAETNQRLAIRLRHGGGTLCCRLQGLMARFWQGEDIDGEYLNLRPLASCSAHGLALLELVYGQLLASRQLPHAFTHLDTGFNLARNLLTASDYFTVMNRHRQLRHLPLREEPSPPYSLEQLLTMAQVIERLEQPEKKRGAYTFDNRDTYG